MNITVINGTEQKGCTYAMKEIFLSALGPKNFITEFYLPRDCPHFCAGCKICFFHDISECPHAKYTFPIWKNILAADLLVFTSPTYVFHVTAQMKALLDHYGSKWMSHSPEKPLFSKQAVIITNAIGAGMGKTARGIQDSLDYWGVARVYTIKQALFQAEWVKVDSKRKAAVQAACDRVAAKVMGRLHVRPRIKVKALFYAMKSAQVMIDKSEHRAGRGRTKDYLHWKGNGWLNGKRPWVD